MHYVYQIKFSGIIRYIGITTNPKLREQQHKRGVKSNLKKLLYQNIYHYHPNEEIILEVIKTYKTKGDATRYEALLILQDYFSNNNLWQSPPRSIKYY